MRSVLWRVLLLVVALSTWSAAASAQAQAPTGKARELQVRRVGAGELAESKRDYEGALTQYLSALALGPSPAATAGTARCHFELGHDAEAFDAYAQLDGALTGAAHTKARVKERLTLLGSRLGTVTIEVTTPETDVELDGQRLGRSPLQMVTKRLGVGKHKLRLVRGEAVQERDVDVAAGATTNVRVPDPAEAEPAPRPKEEEKPPPDTDAGVAAPSDTRVDEPEAWQIAHGSKQYAPVRTTSRVEIDGVLDEPIWREAPKDGRFLSVRSKPYGRPTTEPTVVQVAYDEENLYVAFRCTYGSKRPRDDTFSVDEQTVVEEAESVAVIVDPVHAHANALMFSVSRTGNRVDLELSEGGSSLNLDWRGIWSVATQRGPDAWTAEFKIPFGTLRLPSTAGPATLGINFRRREPYSGDWSLWALHPPATESYDINFFGHLVGLRDVRPGQRLFLQPYVSVVYERGETRQRSPLDDFTGTNGDVRAFAGAYARYLAPGPLRVDATFNPNFIGVTPDRALANFDRFELEFPEQRAFFAEDLQRFQFGGKRYEYGDLGAQLFYSRRIGLRTTTAGLTEVVPMIYGVKSVVQTGGTEAALMNVGLAPNRSKLVMNDNVVAGRVLHTFDEGRRIGVIGLGRFGSDGTYYGAGGVDGRLTLLDRHLFVSGFLAQTTADDRVRSGAGQATVELNAQDFYGSVSHSDIGKAFDAQLGYFPLTGVRAETFAAGYTPIVRTDLVHQVFLDAQLTLARDRGEQRIFDRGVVSATAHTFEQAFVQIQAQPGIEQVAQDFRLANERLLVPAGRYEVMLLQMDVSTAPRRPVVAGLGYQVGDLFDGTRRSPSVTLGFNLGRFTSNVLYRLQLIKYGTQSFTGHQVSGSIAYAYSVFARSALVVETNALAGRGLAQFVTSYQFGTLSSISGVLRATSGSTVDRVAIDWYDRPNLSAVLTFALGVTPL